MVVPMSISLNTIGTLSFLLVSSQPVYQAHSLEEMLAKSTSSLSGRVVIKETGRPVAGARMVPFWISGNGVGNTSATTDHDGHYFIKALPGRWNLGVHLPHELLADYTTVGAIHITLAKGEAKTVNIEAFRGTRVSGKVTLPSGKPAVGAYVRADFIFDRPKQSFPANTFMTMVDSHGNYTLNLPPGSFGLFSACRFGRVAYHKAIDKMNIKTAMHRDLKLEPDIKLVNPRGNNFNTR